MGLGLKIAIGIGDLDGGLGLDDGFGDLIDDWILGLGIGIKD